MDKEQSGSRNSDPCVSKAEPTCKRKPIMEMTQQEIWEMARQKTDSREEAEWFAKADGYIN